jgi:hypothetical protein
MINLNKPRGPGGPRYDCEIYIELITIARNYLNKNYLVVQEVLLLLLWSVLVLKVEKFHQQIFDELLKFICFLSNLTWLVRAIFIAWSKRSHNESTKNCENYFEGHLFKRIMITDKNEEMSIAFILYDRDTIDSCFTYTITMCVRLLFHLCFEGNSNFSGEKFLRNLKQ